MPMHGAISVLVRDKVKSLKVSVHKGSVLSPLLFIIVLEALLREFRSGRTSMPMTLLSLLNRSRNVSGGS